MQLDSDGISQKPEIQLHLKSILHLKYLRAVSEDKYLYLLDYAIRLLERSVDDGK